MDIYMRRIFEKENARVLKKMNERRGFRDSCGYNLGI